MSGENIVPQQKESTFLYSQHACQGRILIKELLKGDKGASRVGEEVTVAGWVKTGRNQAKGAFAFVHISDGSTTQTLQVLIDSTLIDLKQVTPTGTGIAVRGEVVSSPGENQAVELKAKEILYIGACDAKTFPLAKKAHTLEYLRSVAHFRPRSNLFSAIFRVRNALSYATHKFFQERAFIYAHTPIITASDCEGAGEMFQLTNLLPPKDKVVQEREGPAPEDFAQIEAKIERQGKVVTELKTSGASKEEIGAAVKALLAAKEELKQLQSKPIKIAGIPFKSNRTLDYSSDFFGVPAHLTVSGQLQAETFACSLSNTYTFGPTFRAEKSLTSRHLAEFWMIEPEVAFADLFDVMQLAEDYVKYCCEFVLTHNLEDLELIDKWQQMEEKAKEKEKDKEANKRTFSDTSVERVSNIVKNTFKRISYTEAIEILEKSGVKFVDPVSWGIDLSSEHERYIAEKVFNCPTIVYNYPKDIKAFYMRQNEDGKTVAAMDILVPQIGELIGGSQREERFDVLSNRITELGMDVADFWWYLDLRKFGSVIHSGFGLGFERLIMFVTGMENIRDVIPFPRTQLSVNF